MKIISQKPISQFTYLNFLVPRTDQYCLLYTVEKDITTLRSYRLSSSCQGNSNPGMIEYQTNDCDNKMELWLCPSPIKRSIQGILGCMVDLFDKALALHSIKQSNGLNSAKPFTCHLIIMNQTIIIGPSQLPTPTVIVTPEQVAQTFSFDIMMALRILWYIFCIVKIFSIAFFSRPKATVRERVLRKFLISHSELLRTFTEEDKKNMEVILDNTIKNASTRQTGSGSRLRSQNKSVRFKTQNNDYYEPKEWKEEVPVFYDVGSTVSHDLKLDQNSSFQEKKHEEEFIEREDLLGLDEKTEELSSEKEDAELIEGVEKQSEITVPSSDISENIFEPPSPAQLSESLF